MIKNTNYKKIYETENFILGYIFEEAYLTNKITNQNILLSTFYGEPLCGIISKENSWCLVGGSRLVVWTTDELFEIENKKLIWAYDIRQICKNKVEILIDPWSENSSIWEFNITTKEIRKIKDFNEYKNKEYTEHIIW